MPARSRITLFVYAILYPHTVVSPASATRFRNASWIAYALASSVGAKGCVITSSGLRARYSVAM